MSRSGRLVDVTHLPGLDRIKPLADGALRLGALVRNADLGYDAAFASGCKAREDLSNHVIEWATSGRVDVGLVYNPKAQAGLKIIPMLEEPLGLVSHAAKDKRGSSPPLPLKD